MLICHLPDTSQSTGTIHTCRWCDAAELLPRVQTAECCPVGCADPRRRRSARLGSLRQPPRAALENLCLQCVSFRQGYGTFAAKFHALYFSHQLIWEAFHSCGAPACKLLASDQDPCSQTVSLDKPIRSSFGDVIPARWGLHCLSWTYAAQSLADCAFIFRWAICTADCGDHAPSPQLCCQPVFQPLSAASHITPEP